MASAAVWALAILLIAAASGGAGLFLGYELGRAPGGSGPGAANSTLSLLGAGTLDVVFPALARELANETPGLSVPAAAQLYEGSLDVTTGLTALHDRADVAAVADFRLMPERVEPRAASYEVVFASTPEVLCYDPALPAFEGVNASNWGTKLVAAATAPGEPPLAVWNASTDPNGYNEIFSLELQGLRFGGGAQAYYGTFYGGGAGGPAVPKAGTTLIEKESQAAAILRAGVVSAAITYRSYAVENDLSFVPFDPVVGLVSNDSAALAEYSGLSTTIVSATGALETVHPAPVLFAVTVPTDAPNPSLGAAFVHLLLSPRGDALLSAGGAFTPVFPGWVDHPGSVPSLLAPDVVPLPGWAAAELP